MAIDSGEKKHAKKLVRAKKKEAAKKRAQEEKEAHQPKRVPSFVGPLYVLEKGPRWELLDTLAAMAPEKERLVTAVRTGFWVPPVNLAAADIDVLRGQLPLWAGEGRYYFWIETPTIGCWLEATALVEQVKAGAS